jgi:predicted cobalt transporter CbtA
LTLGNRLCFTAAALASVLMFYRGLYVMVPGYNWLAVIGLMGLQAGLYLLAAGRQYWTVALLLGLAGYLTFAGKPTSGIAVLPAALLCAVPLVGAAP